jgi:hypothetical protein
MPVLRLIPSHSRCTIKTVVGVLVNYACHHTHIGHPHDNTRLVADAPRLMARRPKLRLPGVRRNGKLGLVRGHCITLRLTALAN